LPRTTIAIGGYSNFVGIGCSCQCKEQVKSSGFSSCQQLAVRECVQPGVAPLYRVATSARAMPLGCPDQIESASALTGASRLGPRTREPLTCSRVTSNFDDLVNGQAIFEFSNTVATAWCSANTQAPLSLREHFPRGTGPVDGIVLPPRLSYLFENL